MGALRELEYLRLIRSLNPEKYEWYQLGDMVPTCDKVNYKLNYQPGYILCPRTKVTIPYQAVKE